MLALLKSPSTRRGPAAAAVVTLESFADAIFPEAALLVDVALAPAAPVTPVPDKTAPDEETRANIEEGRPPAAVCCANAFAWPLRTDSSTLIDFASGARDALLARGCFYVNPVQVKGQQSAYKVKQYVKIAEIEEPVNIPLSSQDPFLTVHWRSNVMKPSLLL